jgi:hypothetical protein
LEKTEEEKLRTILGDAEKDNKKQYGQGIAQQKLSLVW